MVDILTGSTHSRARSWIADNSFELALNLKARAKLVFITFIRCMRCCSEMDGCYDAPRSIAAVFGGKANTILSGNELRRYRWEFICCLLAVKITTCGYLF